MSSFRAIHSNCPSLFSMHLQYLRLIVTKVTKELLCSALFLSSLQFIYCSNCCWAQRKYFGNFFRQNLVVLLEIFHSKVFQKKKKNGKILNVVNFRKSPTNLRAYTTGPWSTVHYRGGKGSSEFYMTDCCRVMLHALICLSSFQSGPVISNWSEEKMTTSIIRVCDRQTSAVSLSAVLNSHTTVWFDTIWLHLNGKIWFWNILPSTEETNSCWRYRHWYRRRQYSPLRAPYIPCTSLSSLGLF